MSVCGKWAYLDVKNGKYIPWYCNSPRCDKIRCKMAFYAKRLNEITYGCEQAKLDRFLTVTIDPRKVPENETAWSYIPKVWNKFMTIIRRKYPDIEYIAVLEKHKNEDRPHVHAFINRYIYHEEIRKHWCNCGGGYIVDIRKVTSEKISEYASKQLKVHQYVGKQNITDGAYFAPRRQRTIWRSKGVPKPPRFKDEDKVFELIKEEVYNNDGCVSDAHQKCLKIFLERHNGKNEKRENMETTCCSILEQGIETSSEDMETVKAESSRSEEDKSASRAEKEDKRGNKEAKEQLVFTYYKLVLENEVYEYG